MPASSSAAAAAVVGVYASYWLDISTGGSIVLAQAAQFALAYIFAPRKGLLSRMRRRSPLSQADRLAP